jgi:hypothetical protein
MYIYIYIYTHIHSQLIVDLGRCFEEGQAYVALSRASTPDGLQVRNFSQEIVRANRLALEFHTALSLSQTNTSSGREHKDRHSEDVRVNAETDSSHVQVNSESSKDGMSCDADDQGVGVKHKDENRQSDVDEACHVSQDINSKATHNGVPIPNNNKLDHSESAVQQLVETTLVWWAPLLDGSHVSKRWLQLFMTSRHFEAWVQKYGRGDGSAV